MFCLLVFVGKNAEGLLSWGAFCGKWLNCKGQTCGFSLRTEFKAGAVRKKRKPQEGSASFQPFLHEPILVRLGTTYSSSVGNYVTQASLL